MTGFGNAHLSTNKIKATVEIKSLNHRYFDINYYLPIGFSSMEEKIRQIVQRQIERGRITVSIKITQKPAQNIVLNKDIVRKYLQYSRTLRREFGVKGEISFADIVRLPGVFETKESFVEAEKLWPIVEKNIRSALKGVVSMRKREGRSLNLDVADKLKRMSLQIKKIRDRAKTVLKHKQKSLTSEEFRSFQKGSDINEEIARMIHYIDEVKLLLKSQKGVGKKMDFVAQEMQRETNTIGSKLQDRVVSNAVIALKSKIEKIREQSQNIE